MLDVLRAIGVSPLGRRLVLQGGAALHFVYGSPRLTRDLDFVAPPDAFPAPGEVCAAIPGIALRRDDRASVPPFMRLAKRWRYGGVILSTPVEIAGVRVRGRREWEVAPGIRCAVETLDEILTDKVVACIARMQDRGTVKPQDIFDIAYIRRLAPDVRTTPEDVAGRLAAYDRRLDSGTVRRLLDWLASDEAVFAVRDALRASGTAARQDARAVDELPGGLRPEGAVGAAEEVFHALFGSFRD